MEPGVGAGLPVLDDDLYFGWAFCEEISSCEEAGESDDGCVALDAVAGAEGDSLGGSGD